METSLKNLEGLLECPICFDFMNIAMLIQKCSHTFCSLCIRRFLSEKNKCPVCNEPASETDLLNNRLVDELVDKYKQISHAQKSDKKKIINKENFNDSRERKSFTEKVEELRRTTDMLRKSRRSSTNLVNFHVLECSSTPLAPQTSMDASNLTNTEENGCVSMPSSEEDPQGSSDDATPDTKIPVQCPVCQLNVKSSLMNKHLDFCLERDQRRNGLRRSIEKRKPMTKVVYNLLAEKELKKKLKDCGLSTTGSRQDLTKRHHEFTLAYNAECDSLFPKPVEEIIKHVEKMENLSKGKNPLNRHQTLNVNKQSTVEDIKKAQKTYLKQHKTQFNNLVDMVRDRKQSKRHIVNSIESSSEVRRTRSSSVVVELSSSDKENQPHVAPSTETNVTKNKQQDCNVANTVRRKSNPKSSRNSRSRLEETSDQHEEVGLNQSQENMDFEESDVIIPKQNDVMIPKESVDVIPKENKYKNQKYTRHTCSTRLSVNLPSETETTNDSDLEMNPKYSTSGQSYHSVSPKSSKYKTMRSHKLSENVENSQQKQGINHVVKEQVDDNLAITQRSNQNQKCQVVENNLIHEQPSLSNNDVDDDHIPADDNPTDSDGEVFFNRRSLRLGQCSHEHSGMENIDLKSGVHISRRRSERHSNKNQNCGFEDDNLEKSSRKRSKDHPQREKNKSTLNETENKEKTQQRRSSRLSKGEIAKSDNSNSQVSHCNSSSTVPGKSMKTSATSRRPSRSPGDNSTSTLVSNLKIDSRSFSDNSKRFTRSSIDNPIKLSRSTIDSSKIPSSLSSSSRKSLRLSAIATSEKPLNSPIASRKFSKPSPIQRKSSRSLETFENKQNDAEKVVPKSRKRSTGRSKNQDWGELEDVIIVSESESNPVEEMEEKEMNDSDVFDRNQKDRKRERSIEAVVRIQRLSDEDVASFSLNDLSNKNDNIDQNTEHEISKIEGHVTRSGIVKMLKDGCINLGNHRDNNAFFRVRGTLKLSDPTSLKTCRQSRSQTRSRLKVLTSKNQKVISKKKDVNREFHSNFDCHDSTAEILEMPVLSRTNLDNGGNQAVLDDRQSNIDIQELDMSSTDLDTVTGNQLTDKDICLSDNYCENGELPVLTNEALEEYQLTLPGQDNRQENMEPPELIDMNSSGDQNKMSSLETNNISPRNVFLQNIYLGRQLETNSYSDNDSKEDVETLDRDDVENINLDKWNGEQCINGENFELEGEVDNGDTYKQTSMNNFRFNSMLTPEQSCNVDSGTESCYGNGGIDKDETDEIDGNPLLPVPMFYNDGEESESEAETVEGIIVRAIDSFLSDDFNDDEQENPLHEIWPALSQHIADLKTNNQHLYDGHSNSNNTGDQSLMTPERVRHTSGYSDHRGDFSGNSTMSAVIPRIEKTWVVSPSTKRCLEKEHFSDACESSPVRASKRKRCTSTDGTSINTDIDEIMSIEVNCDDTTTNPPKRTRRE